jgi:hypothetical protein
MFQEITVQRLSVKSIYKLIWLGLLFSLVPLCTLMGVFAAFGANTVTWNNAHVHGMWALVTAPLIGIFVSLFLTLLIGTAMSLGLWGVSKFRSLRLTVKQSVCAKQRS